MSSATHHPADRQEITDLFPNARLQFVHGDTMTFAAWEFGEGAKVPSHRHPHEQITHCVEGVLELTVAGKHIVLRPGDTVVIPGDVEHDAFSPDGAKGVDAFQPVREDYRF
ncbi:cupin domain-containing protein [Amycolatopsis sp. VS8301801F10]|uniref:cupin domain-containing protein n=1 Tax=Amycolatopsis sp. VS8301801F10 TaxID=2652442 RepID=UPI0038FC70F8